MFFNSAEQSEIQFECFDTVNAVLAFGKKAEEYTKAAEELCKKYHALFNAHDDTGEISLINRNAGQAVTVSDDTADLLRGAIEGGRYTRGAFDITIGSITLEENIKKAQFMPDGRRRAVLTNVNYSKVKIDGNIVAIPAGCRIDLGGIVKGFTADKLVSLCHDYGIQSALINLGGNVYAVGSNPHCKPWKIGIASPWKPGDICGVAEISDISAVTSGQYERSCKKPDGSVYGHILSPATGDAATSKIISATIFSHCSMQADVLATASFIMDTDEFFTVLRNIGNVDAVLIARDGTAKVTPGAIKKYSLRFKN